LVMPSDDGEPIRARVPRRKLALDETHEKLIDLLAGARLVSSDEGDVQIASGDLADFEVDGEATIEWLGTLDLARSVATLSPRTALLLLHAQGDERVPHTFSRELHEAAGEPKRLLVFPGGHHRSLQHDLEVQNLTAAFLERAFTGR